jgi:hypothetical protein
MAINPTSFPMPQAFSGGVDFSPLANLGNVYRQGQQQAAQQQTLAQLGNDPNANAQLLIKSGVPELVTKGLAMQGQQQADAESARRFGIVHQYDPQAEKRAADAAERANMTAADKAAEVEEMLTKQGINPKSPYGQQIITGIDPSAATKSDVQLQIEQLKLRAQKETATAQDRYNTVKQGIEQGVYPPDALKDPRIQGFIRFGDPSTARQGLGTPIYGRRTDPGHEGELEIYQPSSEGPPTKMQFPEGVTPLGPGEVAAQKAAGKVTGETQAKAEANIPGVEQSVKENENLVNKILNHPGKSSAVGFPSALGLKHIPGSNAADFTALLDQLQGKAFLSVYEQLRGAGAISNMEDLKGTAARLQSSVNQSPEQFDERLKDYLRSVKEGLEVVRKKAGKSSAPTGATVAPPGATTAPPSSGPTDWKTYFGQK